MWPPPYKTHATTIPGGDVPGELLFEFDLRPDSLRVDHDSTSGWDDIRYPGLTPLRIGEFEGGPSLPAMVRPVLLPQRMWVRDVQVLLADRVQIPGRFLPRPSRGHDVPDSIPTDPDPLYYQDGGVFPPRPEFLLANDGYKELKISSFGAVPFEWNGADRSLFLYTRVEVRLTLEPAPATGTVPSRQRPERRFSRGLHEIAWARGHVLNPEDLLRFYPLSPDTVRTLEQHAVSETTMASGFRPTDRPSLEGPPIDLVILTNDQWADGTQPAGGSLEAAFQTWADWRTRIGVPSVVRTLDWVRANYEGVDDPERIRNFLREAYSLWGTDYLILGGDVEVIPARTLGGPTQGLPDDLPSAWYYAGLDSDWNVNKTNPDLPRDGWYGGSTDAQPGDYFPELWVGRFPARDSVEAAQMLAKVSTYELRPGYDDLVPDDSYYTHAVLAAGLTNYGGWSTSDPALAYKNGIYQAERIKATSLGPLQYSMRRFYPQLGTVQDCGGATLPCYKDIKDAFGLAYPPDGVFTAANVRAAMQSDPPSVFFHVEHSDRQFLGGPSSDNLELMPPLGQCEDPPIPDCQNCSGWQGACWAQYKSQIVKGGLTRELLGSLSTHPKYLVGFSYGSLTGAYDQDVVAEQLLRDPDGGAVAFCAKVTSANTSGTTDLTEVPIAFFAEALLEARPIGVALSDAAMANDDVGLNPIPSSVLRYHMFGDPSLVAWTAAPDTVLIDVAMDPDTLANPDIYSIDLTIRDPFTGVPIEGARVCLFQALDVYAIGTTSIAGVARFPAVLVRSVTEGIEVWVTAPNRRPTRHVISPPNYSASDQEPTLVYERHALSDAPNPGPVVDFLEPGNRFTLDLHLRNSSINGLPAGVARLAPVPRIRVGVRFDDVVDNSRVYIGRVLAHPPAFADTFSLLVNEYGIRPEGELPAGLIGGGLQVFKDPFLAYRVYTSYTPADFGKVFRGVILVEAGIDLLTSNFDIDPGDTVEVRPGTVVDTLYFALTGDFTPDSFSFRAEAEEWITPIISSATYDSVPPFGTATVSFEYQLANDYPARTRLNFTVGTRYGEVNPTTPVYSDFYLSLHAPSISLALQQLSVSPSDCQLCDAGDTTFVVVPSLFNSGDAPADSVQVILSGTGLDFVVCEDGSTAIPLYVPAGSGVSAVDPVTFCDLNRSLGSSEGLLIRSQVNGAWQTEEDRQGLAPWPVSAGVKPRAVAINSTTDGFHVAWYGPLPTNVPSAGLLGYHVYVDSASVITRVTGLPLVEAAQTRIRTLHRNDPLGQDVPYAIGVAVVTKSLTQGPVHWQTPDVVNMPEKAGWPKRSSDGTVRSVVLANIDTDPELEIVAAGHAVHAWNPDGSSATADPTGLLYKPVPDNVVSGQPELFFYGDLAAGDIDNDGKLDFAGCYGNDWLYVFDIVSGAGHLKWSRRAYGKSTPTIANLDSASNSTKEVLVNSFNAGSGNEGALYIFRSDGTPFRCPLNNGVFARFSSGSTPPNYFPSDFLYNFSGLAVANLDNSVNGVLEIVQPTTAGWVYAWKVPSGVDNCPNNPPYLWRKHVQSNGEGVNSKRSVSTPAVDNLNGDTFLDVLVVAKDSDRPAVAFHGSNGSTVYAWPSTGSPDVPVFGDQSFVQAPSIGAGSTRPVLVGRQGGNDSASGRNTYASLLRHPPSPTAYSTATDTIPQPGRRSYATAITTTQPLILDLDNDGMTEALIGSNQGGLFAWEIEADQSLSRESGWPIVYSDRPYNPACADIDADTFLELVVPADDGMVHVYDLSAAAAAPGWIMAGYDLGRTGAIPLGGFAERPWPDGEDSWLDRDGIVAVRRAGDGMVATVVFHATQRSSVRLRIFDVGGREVRDLLSVEVPPGLHEVGWAGDSNNGARVPAGVYFARLSIGSREFDTRLVIVR